MRGRRQRRPPASPVRLFNTWISLAFLVLALVLLLVMKSKLADTAASCYVNLAGAPAEQEQEPEVPNVIVTPPPPPIEVPEDKPDVGSPTH